MTTGNVMKKLLITLFLFLVTTLCAQTTTRWSYVVVPYGTAIPCFGTQYVVADTNMYMYTLNGTQHIGMAISANINMAGFTVSNALFSGNGSGLSNYITALTYTNYAVTNAAFSFYTIPFQNVITNLACSSVAGGTGIVSRVGWYNVSGSWYIFPVTGSTLQAQMFIRTCTSNNAATNSWSITNPFTFTSAFEGTAALVSKRFYLQVGDKVWLQSRSINLGHAIAGDAYGANATWVEIKYEGP